MIQVLHGLNSKFLIFSRSSQDVYANLEQIDIAACQSIRIKKARVQLLIKVVKRISQIET